MSESRPLNNRDVELLNMPSITAQMPVTFDNGRQWSEFKGHCNGCDKELSDHLVTGSLVPFNSTTVTIEAVGRCEDCKLVTRFIMRVHDDLSLVTLNSNGWVRYVPIQDRSNKLLDALFFLLQPTKWLSLVSKKNE